MASASTERGSHPAGVKTILQGNSCSLVELRHLRREQRFAKTRAMSATTARLRVPEAPCVPNFVTNLDKKTKNKKESYQSPVQRMHQPYNLPRAVIFPICPRVDASMDCIAGLMAVPETEDRVNWVRSCWRDERLVDVAAAAVVGIEEDPVRNGDIKLGARLGFKG